MPNTQESFFNNAKKGILIVFVQSLQLERRVPSGVHHHEAVFDCIGREPAEDLAMPCVEVVVEQRLPASKLLAR